MVNHPGSCLSRAPDAEEARRRAEQLYRFASAAVSAETIEQVFEAAQTAIGEALRTERSAILLYDDEGTMRFRAWRGLSDAYRATVEGHSPWPRDAQSPAPVLIEDCLEDPAWASYAALFRSEGIAAIGFVPLVSRGQLLGKFMVYYGEPHRFSENDVEITRAIANCLASMIARFQAVAALERTVRENELFAGVLAHDLRNPLSAILTAAQLALVYNEGGNERMHKPLTRILASSERMANMISQLLDFSRARIGGGIQLRRTSTDLRSLARQAIAELELTHAECRFELDARGDVWGEWDVDRLLQVLSNLIGNACQHGDKSSAIQIAIDGSAPDAVALRICNAGAIPPALLPHLFEPFRGRQRRTGDSPGLGLGLYIVREIVRAHHGHVDVISNETDGTSFEVTLPRR